MDNVTQSFHGSVGDHVRKCFRYLDQRELGYLSTYCCTSLAGEPSLPFPYFKHTYPWAYGARDNVRQKVVGLMETGSKTGIHPERKHHLLQAFILSLQVTHCPTTKTHLPKSTLLLADDRQLSGYT